MTSILPFFFLFYTLGGVGKRSNKKYIWFKKCSYPAMWNNLRCIHIWIFFLFFFVFFGNNKGYRFFWGIIFFFFLITDIVKQHQRRVKDCLLYSSLYTRELLLSILKMFSSKLRTNLSNERRNYKMEMDTTHLAWLH